jgi:hypothetical protein
MELAERKRRKKKGRQAVLQYVSIKAYSLTDFKEFAFFGNGRFVRTGGNQRAIPIVFAI